MKGPSAGEVAALLTRDIEDLVSQLLPEARRVGSEMECHDLSGARGDNLKVNVGRGARRGLWKHFAGNEAGDPLDLVAQVLFGGDGKRAYAWAVSWLGLDTADPARLKQERRQAQERREARDAEAEAELQRRMKRARAMWAEALPLERGDFVDRYLLSRGIDLAELGAAPGTIRCHPALPYFAATSEDGPMVKIATLPAMVTAVSVPGQRLGSVHRTWLRPDGHGKAGADEIGHDHKGRVRDAKRVYGPFGGGHLKLWMGQWPDGTRRRCALADFGGDTVHVSEGVEDGLTAACAKPAIAVIAGISIGNLCAIELPPGVRRVVMLRQNDAPDSQAAATYRKAVERWRGQDRRVLEIAVSADCKDINDVATAALGSRALARA